MSADVVIESVPKFVRRYGDHVIEGSNNTIIIFGTDRAKKGKATIDDGLGHLDANGKGVGTGVIHMIAGRADKDPDFDNDQSFLYIARKSDVDDNLGLGGVEKKSSGVATIVAKSDTIRIVGRKDLKISTKDGDEFIFMESQKIKVKVGTNFIHITNGEVLVNVDGKSTLQMTNTTIKANIGSTTITMTSGGTEIKSPKVSTVGGSESVREQWEQALMNAILTHGHMTAMGPTLPVSAGFPPPNPNIIAELQAKWLAFKTQTLT